LPELTGVMARLRVRRRRPVLTPHPGSTEREQSPNAGKSGSLRAAIFGINDGLVSNFSLIMGFAGAKVDNSVILLAGIAGLLAGAFLLGCWVWRLAGSGSGLAVGRRPRSAPCLGRVLWWSRWVLAPAPVAPTACA